jgi:ADP-heptose:LPS heptosyltransferase
LQAEPGAVGISVKGSKVAVYFCNGIGNLLMMTPAIQALSRLYSDFKVDMVMPSEWNDYRAPIIKDILNHWDLIGKVISFPADKFYPKSYKLLFTTAHCEPSQAASLFQQKGNKFEKADWLTDYPHEIEYYMNEVYRLGYKGLTPPIVAPMAEQPVLGGDKPRVAFYNGAASLSKRYRWTRKRWDKFEALAEELHNYYGVEVVCLGGKSEKKEGERLAKKYDHVTNYAGKLSFLESVKVLSQCKLMISTDSALMHAAEAVNVPVVTLFGATMVSKNRPYSGKYSIIRGKCLYAPCQYRSQFYTCKEFKCMSSISAGQVMRSVGEMGVFK